MLLTGGGRPTDAEIEDGAELLKEEIPDYEAPPRSVAQYANLPKPVPDFWLTVLQNYPGTAFMLSEPDEEVLTCLTDVHASYLAPLGSPDPSFRVTFNFSPNPFFSDAVLHKDYCFRRGRDPGVDWEFDGSRPSTISWNPGMDFTQSEEMSFFTFVFCLSRPTDEEKGQLDDDEREMLEGMLGQDLALGEAFKDDVSTANGNGPTIHSYIFMSGNSKRSGLVHVWS